MLGYELSPQQRHLWILQQVDTRWPYMAQCCIRITGDLDRAILMRALQHVLDQNEILRTYFHYTPDLQCPVQIVADSSVLAVTQLDLRCVDSCRHTDVIEAVLRKMRQNPVDREHEPQLQLFLVHLSSSTAMLLVTLPALCADSSALQNIMRAIRGSYEARLAGQEQSEVVLQYADLAAWLNEVLETAEADAVRTKWRMLAPADLPSQLLFSSAISGEIMRGPGRIPLTIVPSAVEKLAALARATHTSLAIWLQACWHALIWRLTSRTPITVGTAFDGRNYAELEPVIGLLSKYIPLQTKLTRQLLFTELVQQIHTAYGDIAAIQEVFDWHAFRRDEATEDQDCYFPLCFDFIESTTERCTTGPSFTISMHYTCIDKFKIKLACFRNDEQLYADIYYDPEAFVAEDVKRLAEQYTMLVASVIDNSDVPIGQLQMLSPAERNIFAEWNSTSVAYLQDQCVHHMIENQAQQTPDTVAIVFGDQQITYAALNRRANQTAHLLITQGVAEGTLVGIYAERSLEMVIGLLAILKAGGAYIPLVPEYPEARLVYMLEDSRARFVLTQEQLREKLPGYTAAAICIETAWRLPGRQADRNPAPRIHIEDLAYVIYTSGSTGRPKGVQVSHRALNNFLSAMRQRPSLTKHDILLAVTTLSFDIAALEIFLPLTCGARMVLVEQDAATNGAALISQLACAGVTVMQATPATWRLLLNAEWPGSSHLTMLCGGEALSEDLAQSLLARGKALWNMYGPTETTIWSTIHQVLPEKRRISLGLPIANTQVYLLDTQLQPVPFTVIGEIYIGGDGLARGYLHRPELTAERFLPDPFSPTPGARLYRTGDLARVVAGTHIEYLGRADNQIKLRGFRIELGEIEAVLRQHTAVQDVVVLVREEPSAPKHLIAYIVPQKTHIRAVVESEYNVLSADEDLQLGSVDKTVHRLADGRQLRILKHSQFSASDLPDFLRERLPDYMVPALFVFLEGFPLTPNGKIDRQVLATVNLAQFVSEAAYVAPRTPVEIALANIWSDALALERVNIHQNFFELGGDSILSVRIIAQANQVGLRLTTRQIFQHPTIAELAALIEEVATIPGDRETVAVPVPLAPIQHWFFEQNRSESHLCNRAAWFEVRKTLMPDILERTVEYLIMHHDVLRLRFVQEETGWRSRIDAPGGVVPFIYVDLSPHAEAERVSIIDATAARLQASIDLSNGPVLQVALFANAARQPDVLLLVMHFLVADIASWHVLLQDLSDVYDQLGSKSMPMLSLRATFRQWAERLTTYTLSHAHESDYWLAEARKQAARLPIDDPTAIPTGMAAGVESAELSREETGMLCQQLPEDYHVQAREVLVTAIVQALAQQTGEQVFLIDIEGSVRDTYFGGLDFSRTVGCLSHIFPVLIDLTATVTPNEALEHVIERLRLVPNQGIGYGALRYLSTDADVVEKVCSIPTAEVCLRYSELRGDPSLDKSPLRKMRNSIAYLDRSNQKRGYLVDIIVYLDDSNLHIDWLYCDRSFKNSTMRSYLNLFIENIRLLINDLLSSKAREYRASDFPNAGLDDRGLQNLLRKFDFDD